MPAEPQPILLYNTATASVEALRTREPGVVRMYVCGPTVYERSHLGHARSYIVYDALKRVLIARGYRVRHVQNFTDIEESIAERAAEAGRDVLDYADDYIDLFHEDMAALRVLPAEDYPRASAYVPRIVEMTQALVDAGAAYTVECNDEGDCHVYFDASKAPRFGHLIHSTLDDIAADRPVPGERRGAADFALWKHNADWGRTWPSPWGEGRPGWHIECTAMATERLGGLDLHGGGQDLVFPHHESEAAIWEALESPPYCGHWVHNGFVTLNQAKMSKSTGNFLRLDEVMDDHDPEALRAYLLSAHYRARLDFDMESFAAMEEEVAGWRATVARLQEAARDAGASEDDAVAGIESRFWAALVDDLHTETALDAARDVLRVGEDAVAAGNAGKAAAVLAAVRRMGDALGLFWSVTGPEPAALAQETAAEVSG